MAILQKKFTHIFFVVTTCMLLSACSLLRNPCKMSTYVKISTSMGTMIVGLYDGTPLHRDNFVQNVKNNVYDSTYFYSVTRYGLIKAGANDKRLDEKTYLHNHLNDSSLRCETHRKIVHKTGALGMCRVNDTTNASKRSDKRLFYFVDGIKTDKRMLKTFVSRRNAPLIGEYMDEYLQRPENQAANDSLNYYKRNRQYEQWNALYYRLSQNVLPAIKADGRHLAKADKYQDKIYLEHGGIPLYDGDYTVFGEVVDGMKVLKRIAKTRVDITYRPATDIVITGMQIMSKKEVQALQKQR